MNTDFLKYTYYIWLGIFASSCLTDVDIDVPNFDTHKVLHAVFSTTDTATCYLSESLSFLADTNVCYVNDADVWAINSTGQTFGFDKCDADEFGVVFYKSTFVPKENETYKLVAVFNETDSIFSEVSIPKQVKIDSCNYNLIGELKEQGDNNIEICLEFEVAEKMNYFIFDITGCSGVYFERGYVEEFYGFLYFDSEINAPNVIYRDSFLYFIDNNWPRFSNEQLNITNSDPFKIDGTGKQRISLNFNVSFRGSPACLLIPRLYTISPDLYYYYESLKAGSEASPLDQPVETYTNISNGLGVFAGKTMSCDSIWLRATY